MTIIKQKTTSIDIDIKGESHIRENNILYKSKKHNTHIVCITSPNNMPYMKYTDIFRYNSFFLLLNFSIKNIECFTLTKLSYEIIPIIYNRVKHS